MIIIIEINRNKVCYQYVWNRLRLFYQLTMANTDSETSGIVENLKICIESD